ncbi:synaptogyrin-1 isoform X1 [Alligator mississippiensis]|uniref:synaptogyrin-1 isoform X1 n=1 Tax=Alligator mississippiensis TaxID=8496 RepID=UPI000711A223|nr:synaptogyrin-1 isoform X1 [Alligator mississippiensis]
MEGGAYGAGKAGGAFDPQTFVRQPHTALRLVSWVFSIVVFGCIVNEGYTNHQDEKEEHCIFNHNHNACNYGITVGVLAFLSCLLYLALDVYFPQISSVKDRKKAVLSDIGVSGLWAFLWFVGFCFLANQWQVSKHEDNPLNEGADAARAAITFSFFSIFTWEPPGPFRLSDFSFEMEETEQNKTGHKQSLPPCGCPGYGFPPKGYAWGSQTPPADSEVQGTENLLSPVEQMPLWVSQVCSSWTVSFHL